MRPPARALETRTVNVDPPPRPSTKLRATAESRQARRREGQMLRRGHDRRRRSKPSAEFRAIVWKGDSLPHARQDRQASSVSRPLEGRQRPKKPGPSLLQVASPVGRGAPVCLRLPVFSRAVNWPLVQIPADRHTTTGTCVLGNRGIGPNGAIYKHYFRAGQNFFELSHFIHDDARQP